MRDAPSLGPGPTSRLARRIRGLPCAPEPVHATISTMEDPDNGHTPAPGARLDAMNERAS
jgi:hypothetical protein